jgi:hypothetical protein
MPPARPGQLVSLELAGKSSQDESTVSGAIVAQRIRATMAGAPNQKPYESAISVKLSPVDQILECRVDGAFRPRSPWDCGIALARERLRGHRQVMRLSKDGCFGLPLLAVFACVASVAGCAASESEPDLPSLPCARDGIVLQGRVADSSDGCVGLEVMMVVGDASSVVRSDGKSLLRDVALGDIVRGRLGQIYSYDRDFHIDDMVVGIAGSWNDILNLELLPLSADSVEVLRGNRRFTAPVTDLVASDCESRLARIEEERASSDAPVRANSIPTEGAPSDPSCGVAAPD